MGDGFVLPPGAGKSIATGGGAMTVKAGADVTRSASTFVVEILPGFDVGAHVHIEAEELFYVLDGELELLAFEPRIRTADDWHAWESRSGAKVSLERAQIGVFSCSIAWPI